MKITLVSQIVVRRRLTFDSRILRYTVEIVLDSMTTKCPGTVAVKLGKVMTLPNAPAS